MFARLRRWDKDDNLIFWIILLSQDMPTLLVKNLPDRVLKDLKRLKIELGCRTWAELLEELVKYGRGRAAAISPEEAERMRKGVERFLRLREEVSKAWAGPPSVVEEFRRMRGHGGR